MFKHLRITREDGSIADVHGTKADMVRFERHFKIPAGRVFSSDGLFIEHLWFYAYVAEGRTADLPAFDEWMETVDSVEIVSMAGEEPAEEDPTTPLPSPSE